MPLSDNQVGDKLGAALNALAGEAETVRGQTALEAARRALRLLSFGLLYAAETGTNEVPGVTKAPPAEGARLRPE